MADRASDNRTREQLLDELDAAEAVSRVLTDMTSRMAFVHLLACPACTCEYDHCESGHPLLHISLCSLHSEAVKYKSEDQ